MTVVLGYVPSAPGFVALDLAIQEATWRGASLADERSAELIIVGLHRWKTERILRFLGIR